MNEKLLAYRFETNRNEKAFESINWWERKRIIFNGFKVLIQAITIGMYWNGKVFGMTSGFLLSIAYLIIGNVMFTIGLASELLSIYYFGDNK